MASTGNLIPLRCFSCGMVLADKYHCYLDMVMQKTMQLKKDNMPPRVAYLTADNIEVTIIGEVLNEMKIEKICCRRHFITHI